MKYFEEDIEQVRRAVEKTLLFNQEIKKLEIEKVSKGDLAHLLPNEDNIIRGVKSLINQDLDSF